MKSQELPDNCVPPLNSSCRPMPVSTEAVLINSVLASISLLTVILNLFVIIAIALFRHLRTPTNLILLSLAVSDLLVGLVLMPVAIISLQFCWLLSKISCTLSYLLSVILTSSSIGNMLLISVDRYVAVCYPMRYSSMITSDAVKISVSLCWTCSIVYSVIILKVNFLNSCNQECTLVINYIAGTVDLILTFFGPVTVIIVLYMRVFAVAVSQARFMRSQISAVKSNTVIVKKSEIRAARTLGIVLLVFILCLCPYYCPCITGQEKTGSIDSLVQVWLFFCNSTFNPLIYAFFYPWFRKVVKIIVSLDILKPGSHECILTK